MTTAEASPTAAPVPARRLAAPLDVDDREVDSLTLRRGSLALAAVVALVLGARLTAWPPHEDEVLALAVGRLSLDGLLETVLSERGGAPLHFVAAWVVAHLGGGLAELRLVSAAAVVAAVPALAALSARIAGRSAALVATALAAASWMLLFHGIYGRMYGLFLLTSTLSYLALLRALERGGRRRWAAWVIVALLTAATHPYAVLVLASQGVFVLLTRARLRESITAFLAVGVLGMPFWLADVVLAGRFEVGVGPGGDKLGDPWSILRYLFHVAGDFTVGWAPATGAAVAAFLLGLWLVARRRAESALLVGCVVVVPTVAFTLARLGASTAPETRHLIFVLPFFLACAAVPVAVAGRRIGVPAAALVVAAGCAGAVAWGWNKTPELFTGDPAARAEGREAAARWLSRTGRRDDVLLGYDPVYLRAWELGDRLGRLVLPRADAELAVEELRGVRGPLGRGVWVFDAYDTNNVVRQLDVERRLPWPADEFEARAFGPYLVVRTRLPTGTPRRYVARAAAAQLVGKSLGLGDADINFATVAKAATRLGYAPSRPASRSTSSR